MSSKSMQTSDINETTEKIKNLSITEKKCLEKIYRINGVDYKKDEFFNILNKKFKMKNQKYELNHDIH